MYKERRINKKLIEDVLAWIISILIAAFLGVVCVYAFGMQTSVVGSSMEPTLSAGQSILLNRVSYQLSAPKRGDIIAFRPNGNINTHLYVKRVIGLPGEEIQIVGGKVYINGNVYMDDVAQDTPSPGIAAETISLGADEYFVLGDNRKNSEDSRSANIGSVSRGMIEGRVWYQLDFGKKKRSRVE